jgi:hypothetical protein
MHETLLKLRILASAELNLARITARRLANRATLLAIAVGLLLLAVVMVNIGVYDFLLRTQTPSMAAFLVAAGDGVVAVLAVIIAMRLEPGPEEQMARQVREMAFDELAADVDDLKDELAKVGTDVKRIRTGFAFLARSGSITSGLASIAPVISVIADTIKERRTKKKQKKEQQKAQAEEESQSDE